MPPGTDLLSPLPKDPLKALTELGRRLSEFGRDRDVVLIGGQALYLWSLRYPTNLQTHNQTYLTSADIDYVRGAGSSIELLAEHWSARKYIIPGWDDHTPNEALVYFVDVEDQEVIVDILANVHGLDKSEILAKADRLPVDGVPIWLMNPIHCLFSRMANATGLGYGESRLNQELVRIRASIEIFRHYLIEQLEDSRRLGNPNCKAVNYLVHLCRWPIARKVARRFYLNAANALPLDHPFWGSCEGFERYQRLTLKPLQRRLDRLIVSAQQAEPVTGAPTP